MKKIIILAFTILIMIFTFAALTLNQAGSSTPNNDIIEPSDSSHSGMSDLTDKNTPEGDKNNIEQQEPDKNETGSEQNKTEPEKSEQETDKNDERVVDPEKPMVALTFDDGPHPEYTIRILDALKEYKAKATFFIVGNRAEKFKSTVKKIAENGNQIGNHTYDHKQLTKLSSAEIKNEIGKTSEILQGISGIKPGLLRPTYGSVNKDVKLYAGSPLMLWSIDTLDWKTKNKDMVVKEVLGKVKDGDVVLMHDIYKTTAEAAEVIIKELDAKGYQMVSIEELYAARGIKMENGKAYSSAYKHVNKKK